VTLLVVSRYPWPQRTGDQRRTVEMVAALAGMGEVVVLSPRPPRRAPAPPSDFPARLVYYAPPRPVEWPVRAAGALLGRHPLETVFLGATRDLVRRLGDVIGAADLVVLQLTRLSPLLAALPPELPLVVDLIDSLALNFTRRAAAGSPFLAPLFRLGAARHRRAEAAAVARAAATLLVAEGDRAHLAERLGPSLASRLAVVPLLAPAFAAPPVAPAAPGERLIVTGNLGYFPTRHGVEFLLREVWPGLRAARPGLELVLAGARLPRSWRGLAARSGVTLLADPPELVPHLAAAAVALAPLEAGTGQPIKILEAWAVGVPVVASPVAAAGVGGRDGIDLRVATSPPEWHRVLLELLDDAPQRRRLAAAGRARLAADFSPEAVTAAYRRVFEPLLRGSAGRSSG
jgi:polysaccharide biosynthesis protein PslH